MPFDAADTHYLEDFLDANEAMDVFGDRNDLDLRPPPSDTPGAAQPEPEIRTHVEMSARAAMSLFT